MSSPQPASSRNRDQRDRDLRAITADGVSFSVMVGVGESYIPAFAIAIGMGDIAAGLFSTLPMLVGACLQLVSPYAVRRVGSYRRWIVACAQLQALSFAPLVIGALLGRLDIGWVAVATVGYWASGMATGPAWNAWITSLVPASIRETFFARRTRAAQAALLGGLLVGGIVLEAGRKQGFELFAFAALFAAAFAARLVSARYLSSQSEDPDLVRRQRVVGMAQVWRDLRGDRALRVLRYLLAMQVVTHIAAPYFTPYMLSHLGLSYGEFMILIASAFLARVAVMPLLGRIARDGGAQSLLWLGGIAIVPLPALWLVSDAFSYLLFVQLLAGCAWGAIELSTTLSFFEGIDEADRTSVLSAFNLANALAIACGSLIGAQLMSWLGDSPWLYTVLFIASTTGRMFAAILLLNTPAGGRIPTLLSLRTLSVRPGGVAVQRPILEEVEAGPGAAAEPNPR